MLFFFSGGKAMNPPHLFVPLNPLNIQTPTTNNKCFIVSLLLCISFGNPPRNRFDYGNQKSFASPYLSPSKQRFEDNISKVGFEPSRGFRNLRFFQWFQGKFCPHCSGETPSREEKKNGSPWEGGWQSGWDSIDQGRCCRRADPSVEDASLLELEVIELLLTVHLD